MVLYLDTMSNPFPKRWLVPELLRHLGLPLVTISFLESLFCVVLRSALVVDE